MSEDNADNANNVEEISDEQFDAMLQHAGIDDVNRFIQDFDEEAKKDDGTLDEDESDGDYDNDESGYGDGDYDDAEGGYGDGDCDNAIGVCDQQEDNGCDENEEIDAPRDTSPANPDD
ncbi:unnamed protein product, partial [Rotaria sp. Silwood1]